MVLFFIIDKSPYKRTHSLLLNENVVGIKFYLKIPKQANFLKVLLCNNMILTRLLTRSRVVRTAFASKRGFKQTIDEPVDEQFHFVPMGKSDISLQSRVSFISRDMSTDKRVKSVLKIESFSVIGK